MRYSVRRLREEYVGFDNATAAEIRTWLAHPLASRLLRLPKLPCVDSLRWVMKLPAGATLADAWRLCPQGEWIEWIRNRVPPYDPTNGSCMCSWCEPGHDRWSVFFPRFVLAFNAATGGGP